MSTVSSQATVSMSASLTSCERMEKGQLNLSGSARTSILFVQTQKQTSRDQPDAKDAWRTRKMYGCSTTGRYLRRTQTARRHRVRRRSSSDSRLLCTMQGGREGLPHVREHGSPLVRLRTHKMRKIRDRKTGGSLSTTCKAASSQGLVSSNASLA